METWLWQGVCRDIITIECALPLGHRRRNCLFDRNVGSLQVLVSHGYSSLLMARKNSGGCASPRWGATPKESLGYIFA